MKPNIQTSKHPNIQTSKHPNTYGRMGVWEYGRVVGLTGSIATGKTTVAEKMKRRGAFVIYADEVGRDVLEKGTPAFREVVAQFGKDVLAPDGQIDRRKLGAAVFYDPTARRRLNRLTHPRMRQLILQRVNEWRSRAGKMGGWKGGRLESWKSFKHSSLQAFQHSGSPPLVVVEAALLFEIGLHRFVDEVWVTVCDEREQLERLMTRNRFSLMEAKARIAAQLSSKEFERRAHRVIWTRKTSSEEGENP